MHGVTHTLDEIRERGVPGFEVEVIGTDPNVDRRLPRRRRGRHPVLRRPEGRRPEPAGDRRGARRGPLRPRAPLLARPGRGRRRADRPDRWSCRCSAATTPSSPPTPGCAPATRGCERAMRHGARRASTAGCDLVLSPSAVGRRVAARARHRGRAHRALGPRRRHRALRPAHARPGPAARASSTCSTPGASDEEKGADLLADAFLAARERDPRLHLVPRRRRPRGGRAARAPRRARDVPRLARGRRARARLRQRRRLPVRQPHRHVRPGPPRGAGQRAAGRRGRRGRAAVDHRGRRTGLLCPPDPTRWPTPSSSSPSPLLRQRLARAALAAVRERTWERSLERLAAGYRRALGEDAGERQGADHRPRDR